ncbi:ABC transporter ATP-binding protein [Erysipelothrix inopinata]|uniref:ABC transporter ATP-binding protein n=1 Tax=Erysipelothrix inopinata TaxID=225084 RepID=A0A7G9RY62_9FIRM|nr:ABC transporter ATP-binding protein [Erysipelothrix inopinata]QNN60537.1 ABC transporter ATP-binding protein [Erysipelothrix inopinata]
MKISLSKVTKTFLHSSEKIQVLDDINYLFESGKIYTIVGKSGVGKTTLLNIISLLDNPSSGHVCYDSIVIDKIPNKELPKFRQNNIGAIFQEYQLIDNMTCLDNVLIPLWTNETISKDEAKRIAKLWLSKLGLKNRISHYPMTLSGGEQQRTAIARALVSNPKVVLADEPTGNVDEESEKIILDIFRTLADQGKLVIIVTHSKTVKDFADISLKLEEGKLVPNEYKF